MKILILVIFSLTLASCGDELRFRQGSSSGSVNPLTAQVCEAVYKPVCGQPPMPVCPPGIFCTMVMPSPQTYDNECQMNKAEAKLINEGTCTK